MALVSATIYRALRLIDCLDVNGTPAAEDVQTAIIALNAMCRRWEANGMAMGWNDVSAGIDTLPAPAEAEEAIAYNLALRLAPEYNAEPRRDVVDQARESLTALRRDRLAAAPLVTNSDLPCAGHWNIYTDEAV